jgi:hypothetical protein
MRLPCPETLTRCDILRHPHQIYLHDLSIVFFILSASERGVWVGFFALHCMERTHTRSYMYIDLIIHTTTKYSIKTMGYHKTPNHAKQPTFFHVSFIPLFSFSSSLISMTLNSLLANITTLNTTPGKYPPPIPTASLQLRPLHSSKSTSMTHSPALAGTVYFASASATSSETYGTAGRVCVLDVGAAGVLNPYPPDPFFPAPSRNSVVVIIPTFTGGSGRKYSAYALAAQLAIAARLGMNVDMLARRRRCGPAAMRGRSERRRV